MDPFDDAVRKMSVEETTRLRNLCICGDCPTYNSCAEDAGELLYCVYGKSFHCVVNDLGCICPGCPVTDEIGLVELTFCILGSESDQRFSRKI